MDYSKLGWQEFEMLCARLLQAAGNTLQGISAKGQDIKLTSFFLIQVERIGLLKLNIYQNPEPELLCFAKPLYNLARHGNLRERSMRCSLFLCCFQKS